MFQNFLKLSTIIFSFSRQNYPVVLNVRSGFPDSDRPPHRNSNFVQKVVKIMFTKLTVFLMHQNIFKCRFFADFLNIISILSSLCVIYSWSFGHFTCYEMSMSRSTYIMIIKLFVCECTKDDDREVAALVSTRLWNFHFLHNQILCHSDEERRFM